MENDSDTNQDAANTLISSLASQLNNADDATVKRIVKQKRIEICKTCEFFTPRYFCSVCGCFMPVKARLPFTTCPKGKW